MATKFRINILYSHKEVSIYLSPKPKSQVVFATEVHISQHTSDHQRLAPPRPSQKVTNKYRYLTILPRCRERATNCTCNAMRYAAQYGRKHPTSRPILLATPTSRGHTNHDNLIYQKRSVANGTVRLIDDARVLRAGYGLSMEEERYSHCQGDPEKEDVVVERY
jgi:hypothetical protein